jgi:lipoic acid synthetase
MVGMGERNEEIREVMYDLVSIGCDLLTIGQYLSPSDSHSPVDRYLSEEEFSELADMGKAMGFRGVASGYFVRSSYKAKSLLDVAIPEWKDGK